MTDKPITYADLPTLRELRDDLDRKGALPTGTALPLLDRLIAAAEADQPPLPEGWVVYTDSTGARRVVWNEAGHLSLWAGVSIADGAGDLDFLPRDRLSPLRPTITEADVEKAVDAYFEADMSGDLTDRGAFRKAFAAAGIEVAR